MRVVVSQAATEFLQENGGRVYVWIKRAHCCGGARTLETSSDPPPHQSFRRVEGIQDFELFLPAQLTLPEELQIEVRRFPRRIEAYWNGCVWVT